MTASDLKKGVNSLVEAAAQVLAIAAQIALDNIDDPARLDRIVTQTIAEHVRAVGKLVGLEVSAKETTRAHVDF